MLSRSWSDRDGLTRVSLHDRFLASSAASAGRVRSLITRLNFIFNKLAAGRVGNGATDIRKQGNMVSGNSKRVLITGSLGQIGTELCIALARLWSGEAGGGRRAADGDGS